MQKRTREILAVLLLGLLVLAGVGAMGYYMFIGHNWNVAASNIDDSIGQMDGYTVVLFEGTQPLEDESEPQGDARSGSAAQSANDSGEQAETPDDAQPNGEAEIDPATEEAPVSDEVQGEGPGPGEGLGPDEGAQPVEGEQAELPGEEAAPDSADSAEPEDPEDPVDPELTDAAAEAHSGDSDAASKQDAAEIVADMNAVVESYRDKGATVFVVDPSDLSRYTEPFVVAKNGMRMGFLAAGKATRRSVIRADAQYLSKYDVDYIVALTNDVNLYRAAENYLIGDVSLIVCDDPSGKFPAGKYYGSAYCARTPYVGEVGAIIISPSGVLSYKSLDGWQDT